MGFLSRLFGGGKQAPPEGGRTLTYRVGINETWRTLAKRFYGDDTQWERVYRDNERILRDEAQTSSDPLLPGTEVTIRDARFGQDGRPAGMAASAVS